MVLVFVLGIASLGFAQKLVQIDGSSTVYLISEAVAEEFQKAYPNVKVVVGISGTGGGFKKFTRGETDISNASRPIKSSEMEAAQQNGIEYIEIPVAFDALAVVVNKDNDWAKSMTVEELKKLWEPESKVTMWSDIRPEWPKEKITLFGPGVDSGTFEYFTEAIVGEAGKCRGDFVASEDDNVLVQGVSQDKYALGYFGVAYYVENQDVLNAVAIDSGNGPVEPLPENVINNTYRPLARPLFIYVNKKSAERDEVARFVEFYLKHAARLAEEVGYVPLPEKAYELASKRFEKRKTGSVFGGKGATPGVSIEEILRKEGE
ncbi:MAG: PstS family phosphate ABC transporter substrate-binding protein [Atribacterota bacterium]